MKIGKRVIIAAGIAAVVALIPVRTSAWWLGPAPGIGPWRHAYVQDPTYRFGSPALRHCIRDLHLYGPVYADWNQRRHQSWRWW